MNKEPIHLRAYAKVNLALNILRIRDDGYHELDMINQSVSLFDDLYLNVNARGAITLSRMEGSDEGTALPAAEDNLIYRAASLMRQTYAIREGVDIGFIKRIPIEAGLGGGSSDAAAVMRGMNKLFDLKLKDGELERLGLKLGADVPFFIRGGTVRVGGIGERLRRLTAPEDIAILLIKPSAGLSTGEIYREYDSLREEEINRPDIEKIAESIGTVPASVWAKDIGNVLERPALRLLPEIGALKEKLLDLGALASAMTGSGSAVFGIFNDLEEAGRAAAGLKGEVYLLKTVSDIEG